MRPGRERGCGGAGAARTAHGSKYASDGSQTRYRHKKTSTSSLCLTERIMPPGHALSCPTSLQQGAGKSQQTSKTGFCGRVAPPACPVASSRPAPALLHSCLISPLSTKPPPSADPMSDTSSEADWRAAVRTLKEKGSQLFAEQDWAGASACYTEALISCKESGESESDDTRVMLLGNRRVTACAGDAARHDRQRKSACPFSGA